MLLGSDTWDLESTLVALLVAFVRQLCHGPQQSGQSAPFQVEARLQTCPTSCFDIKHHGSRACFVSVQTV